MAGAVGHVLPEGTSYPATRPALPASPTDVADSSRPAEQALTAFGGSCRPSGRRLTILMVASTTTPRRCGRTVTFRLELAADTTGAGVVVRGVVV